jgi:hypothetical protein
MTKWNYGLAYYDGGVIEPDAESMTGISPGTHLIAHFFEDAGADGWEFCILLPGKTKSCLIFKRPAKSVNGVS